MLHLTVYVIYKTINNSNKYVKTVQFSCDIVYFCYSKDLTTILYCPFGASQWIAR